MAVKFKVYQSKSKLGGVHGKYFARAYTGNDSVMDLHALAEHMSEHNTNFSEGTIYGVLTDMVNCIREKVLEGRSVKLDNLAIFWLGLDVSGKGVDDPKKFNAQSCIKRAVMRARATGKFSSAQINNKVSFMSQEAYTDLTAKAAGTTTGTTTTDGGSKDVTPDKG